MLTAASALRWEIRRGMRFNLWLTFFALLTIASCTLVPIFNDQLRGYQPPSEFWRTTPSAHLGVTAINLAICLFGVGQGIGMSNRQYSLPVTSQSLATRRLVPGALWSTGLYLIVSILFNVCFAAGWPCLGPALTYGVSFMVMYATVYRFRGNDNRMAVAGLLMGVIVLLWIYGHYFRPDSPDKRIQAWLQLSITEVLILGLVAVQAWRSLVETIRLDRQGAGWGRVIHASAPLSISAGTRRTSRRPFWSAGTAVFWFEWKQNGWLVPCIVIGTMSLVAILNVVYQIWSPSFRKMSGGHVGVMMSVAFAFIPLAVAAPWFSSLFTSHGKRAISQQLWPTSQSTLPISDCVLGWIIFACCLASSLVSLLGVLLVGALWMGVVELIGMLDSQATVLPTMGWGGAMRPEVLIYVATIAFIAWIAAALSTATSLSGRRWIAAIPLGIIPVWIGVTIASAMIPGPGPDLPAICLLLGWSFVGMLVAYAVGTMWGIIGGRSLVTGGAILLATEGMGLLLWDWPMWMTNSRRAISSSPSEFYLLVTLLALAAAPPAILPLATYYNRHR